MPPLRLAIVGASARAAAMSARRVGLEVLAADLFADADLQAIAPASRVSGYPHGLADWLELNHEQADAWIYTGALENEPDLIDRMAAALPLWGNAGNVLRAVRSPFHLAEALRAEGLQFPETRNDSTGLPRDGSWLVKTGRGASGSGVRALLADEDSPDTRSPLPSGDRFFQRRISGTPAAAVFVGSDSGAALLGVTRQLVGDAWTGAGPFQYCGSIGPLAVAEAAARTIERIGQVLIERFALRGLFGVDLIIDGADVWPIEVNPRYTASVEVVERMTGRSALARHVIACAPDKSGDSTADARRHFPANTVDELPPKSATHYGKAVLFAKQDWTIERSFTEWCLKQPRDGSWPSVADIPNPGTSISAGRPLCTVLAAGESAEDVLRRLRDAALSVETQLASYTSRPCA